MSKTQFGVAQQNQNKKKTLLLLFEKVLGHVN